MPVVLLLFLFGCVHKITTKEKLPEEKVTELLKTNKTSPEIPKDGWVITQNPHPKVLEMHKGYYSYNDQHVFYFDTLAGPMDKNEALQIAKVVLNCPPEDDFIYFEENHFLNKKSAKNGMDSKYGGWHHKGVMVDDYRISFRAFDKGKLTNRLSIKYNKEFDADLSSLMSIDSAVKIVRANALEIFEAKDNSGFLNEDFCWDGPYDQQCSPNINLRIFPNIKAYEIKDYVLYYMICIDRKMSSFKCKSGMSVNCKNGEVIRTASPAGNTGCSTCEQIEEEE